MTPEVRSAAVVVCRLWFTDNAPEGSQHFRKAMLALRTALDSDPRECGVCGDYTIGGVEVHEVCLAECNTLKPHVAGGAE